MIFFGTPDFADASLQQLLQTDHRVLAVVTQPDRPKGRSKDPVPPPVKETAQQAGIPVFQPSNLREEKLLQQLRSLQPDLAVVVAYGRILPAAVLQIFPRGAINLHASLLPKFRGAAPIQWALIQGESETGVTLFQLDDQLDHGGILAQARLPIYDNDTAITLTEELSRLGNLTLLKTLERMSEETLRTYPQDESLASAAPRLTKADGIIDWRQDCRRIHNRVRGVQPWPGATTTLSGQPLKILSTTPDPSRHDPALAPGTIATADPAQGLWVQTGQGQIRIDRLQAAGGTDMETAPFLRGHPIPRGTILASEPV